ncbi:MAG: carboxypeptidase-like regulatory domain-containing protein [Acidobacteria bacterium]|nr:carboxypeptidase-like regulatory domain-containing protein [Acidobacteriota bacterium]
MSPTTDTDNRAKRRALVALFLALAACASLLRFDTRAQETGARADEAAKARARGSITVRVVDDANQPVRNATVLALNQGQSSRLAYDSSAARTGMYVISNLDPGVYRITAFAPGFIPEFDFTAPASTQPLYRPGDSVTLRLTKGGVVTGRVADADGNAVVGARVTAIRVRDLLGRAAQDNAFEGFRPRERRTDDRGVYRLYGLTPGSYIVLAGGKPQFSFSARPNAYDLDAPTYYPSTTRDGAVELQVQTGQELTDIDIRYRGDKGHSISGAVAGAIPSPTGQFTTGVSVTLLHAATGSLEGMSFLQGDPAPRTFSLDGIADGEYDLVASSFVQNDTGLSSPPVRVSVRGADVTGLRLVLAPLGSLAGRVGFEPLKPADAAKPECQRQQRAFVPQEALVFARRDGGDPQQPRNFFLSGGVEAPPDAKGDFALRNLRDGRYRLGARLLDECCATRRRTCSRTARSPSRTSRPAATYSSRAPRPPTQTRDSQRARSRSTRTRAPGSAATPKPRRTRPSCNPASAPKISRSASRGSDR